MMHRVYNRMHKLHCTLQQVLDTEKLCVHTEKWLESKKVTSQNMYDSAAWRSSLLQVAKLTRSCGSM